MEKTTRLKRLEMPNHNPNNEYTTYEKKLQPRTKFESEKLKMLYERHKNTLVRMAEEEVWKYLDDFGAWDAVPEECFLCASRMTGEWYVGDVGMYENENSNIRGNIYMRFLGYYQLPAGGQTIDDYLGMDFWVDYDSKTDTFIFDCFNTDVI